MPVALFLLLFAGADPFVGTWHLNLMRSKWANGQPPKQQIVHMEETPQGVRYSSETINTDGTTTTSWYTAKYDGKEVHVVGNVYWDPVSLTRTDGKTVVATYRKRGNISAVATRMVSKDGNTMTITTVGKNRSGKKFTNVCIYDRK